MLKYIKSELGRVGAERKLSLDCTHVLGKQTYQVSEQVSARVSKWIHTLFDSSHILACQMVTFYR